MSGNWNETLIDVFSIITEPLEWEDFDEEDNVVDLRAYHVVGGIFTFDLLCLPPQPKVCKNWTITQCEHLFSHLFTSWMFKSVCMQCDFPLWWDIICALLIQTLYVLFSLYFTLHQTDQTDFSQRLCIFSVV